MRLAVACAVACVCLAACDSPRSARSPEWIEFSGGVTSPEGSAKGAVDEGGTLGIAGGYDFVQGPLRPGIEFGFIGSGQDVPDPADVEDGYLHVARYMAGMRLQADLGEAPVELYARGGYVFHDAWGSDVDAYEVSESGYYAGAGVEWWYAPWGSMGVYAMYSSSFGDGFEEWLFGLAFRFSIPSDDHSPP